MYHLRTVKMQKVLILSLLFCSTLPAKLPDDFPVCKRSDNDITSCLKKAIDQTLPTLLKGVPKLGLPPLEPITVGEVIVPGTPGAVNFEQKYKNMQWHHLLSSKIMEFQSKITDTEAAMDFVIHAPQVDLTFEYDFQGRILFIPIDAKGKTTVILEKVIMDIHFSGEVEKEGGYLKINDIKAGLLPEKIIVNLKNFLNGNEELENQINQLVNENWRELYDEVKEGYEEIFIKYIRTYLEKIFNKIPYDELFPK